MEKAFYLDACSWRDKRYDTLSENLLESKLPNEYEIQSLSGVYDILAMFTEIETDPEEIPGKRKYEVVGDSRESSDWYARDTGKNVKYVKV